MIHDHSAECSLSPLEWFCIPPTQTAVEKTYDVDYQPLTTIRPGAPIEFYIPASTEEYLDLKNTRLHITCRIVKNDGTNCTAADVAAPVNDLFNSLWSNLELFLNDRLISHSNNTHGYTSVISHLIHDSEESLHSERPMRLIYKDTAGSMNAVAAKTANASELITNFSLGADGALIEEEAGNHGLHQRFLHTRTSKEVMLTGGLRIDLFEQNRYLPNGINMKLRLHRQKDEFVLMAGANTFKIEVTEAFLTIRKVKVSPGVLLGHTDALMKSPAKFPITRKECKVLAIPAGFQSFVKDNIFLGQLPRRLVIGMVHNAGFAGTVTRNPYNFEHFGINYMQLYTDGEPVQSKPLRLNIDSGKYLDAFEALSKSFDKFDGDKSSIIKREDWPKGYSLFSFDLTPDFDGEDHYALIRHGNLRLEMNFAATLANTINIIVYAEFDNIIEISSNRNIQFDYSS